jgi:hypothetical protein
MRFFIRVKPLAALAAALALPLACAAPAPLCAQDGPTAGQLAATLRQLVLLHLEWRGPAYGELQSIHERLYVQASDGSRLPASLWVDRDGRTRREVDAPGAQSVQVAAPESAWRAGPDGKAMDDPGGYERARRYAALEFGDALTGRAGATATLAGQRDFMDKSWIDVRVSFGDADTYDVLLDGPTGGLCCYLITEKGVTRTVMFGQWRLIDGVRMPFAELVQSGGQTVLQVSAVELNRRLDASLFAKPPAG